MTCSHTFSRAPRRLHVFTSSFDIDFTITAEIHARPLANFYCQYADRHTNLRERAIRQFDVGFSCVCPDIDNEFRHNIVKVVCRSTRLAPRGSTATLTMLWRNSLSKTGQTHENWRLFVNWFIGLSVSFVTDLGDYTGFAFTPLHRNCSNLVFNCFKKTPRKRK